MIKVITFDLDNTLIDFMTFKRKTASAAARAMIGAGLKGSVKEVSSEIFKIYDEYGIEYQRTFTTLLKKRGIKGLNKFEHILQAGISAYQREKFDVLKPYPGVKQVLKQLSEEFELYIVTDAVREKAWQRLFLTGLDKSFPEKNVMTFDDTKVRKPDSGVFKKLLEKAKVEPGEILFIGDSIERDIKGAKKAGMKTALAVYGNEGKKGSEADFELESIGEVVEVCAK